MDNLLRSYHDKNWFNGCALVYSRGRTILREGYGAANLEWSISNTPTTKFRIGSLTKQFTSFLIMLMVAEGKLRLTDRLSDMLPYYRKDTGNKVTLHHLLNHTSGIPSFTSQPGLMTLIYHNPHSVRDFVSLHCSGDLEFEPGSEFVYNNSGYYILGAIIEEVLGTDYESVLHSKVLAPFGLTNTGYDRSAPIITQRAAGYERTLDGLVNTSYMDMSLPFSSGGLYSTVDDLLKWHQLLQNSRILPLELEQKMFEPGLGNYAYGWGMRKVAREKLGDLFISEYIPDTDGVTIHLHQGGINGFHSLILRVVEDDTLIVLLNNTGGTILEHIAGNILSLLNGKELKPVLRSGAQALYTGMRGGYALPLLYNQLLSTNEYWLNVEDFIQVSNHLCSTGLINNAREMLEFAVLQYPGNQDLQEMLLTMSK